MFDGTRSKRTQVIVTDNETWRYLICKMKAVAVGLDTELHLWNPKSRQQATTTGGMFHLGAPFPHPIPLIEAIILTNSVTIIIIIIIITYPLTARVDGVPQMISQPAPPFFSLSPLPSGTWRTPGLSILWCCLPTSSSVRLVFFPLFTVPCKMLLARPYERETWPYHCSFRLFMTEYCF